VIAEYNVQHRGILRAIDQRDAQVAGTLIEKHLAKARDDLLQANSP
jgi:DNA-binding GntR family transcriptional regulator